MNIPTNLKYFLYARKSSESEDRQVASIASQIDELKTLAKREDLKIVATLIEEKSAKAPGRPVFTSMIERIHAGEAKGIVCWKLDRLARNPIDGGTVSWMLQQGTIQHIQTFERSYYPTDNVLMMSVEFGSANQFILDLSANTKRGLRRRISEGWIPQTPALGYLSNTYKDPSKPPIYKDPERFDLVRKLWQVLLEKKYSISQVKRVADEIGLRTRKGKKVSESIIHHTLTNPFYYGVFRWKGELYPGKHEPMITKAEFEAAQKIINNRYKSQAHYKQFAFAGLIRCGECGAGITAETKIKRCKNGNTHEYTYYRCTKGITPKCTQKTLREDRLEEQILEILGKITIPPEFHQWAMKYLKEEHGKEKADQEKIREVRNNAIKLCEKKISSLIDLRINGEIEAEVFKRRKDELLEEKERLEELSEDAGHRVETWANYAEKVFEFAEKAKNRFEMGGLEVKKQILSCLGTSLVLKNRTLEICLQPPLELIAEVALEVQAVHSTLEPAETPTNQGDWEEIYNKNDNWLPR